MKESYDEGVASHVGPESCLDDPRGRGEPSWARRPQATVDRGKRRRAIELRAGDSQLADLPDRQRSGKSPISGRRPCGLMGKATRTAALEREWPTGPAES